jgi:hypothetical protein
MAEEVITDGTFRRKPLTTDRLLPGASGRRNRNAQNQPERSLEESVRHSLQRVRKFSAAVNQKIEKRFDDNKPQASPEDGEVFSMEKTLTETKDDIPDELMSHDNKARKAGFLE